MAYEPTPGPLPGEQWIPSNSDDGYAFLYGECAYCARDRSMRECAPIEECDDDELCQIIGASFRSEAVEWRRMPDGEVKCIAFVPADAPPGPSCAVRDDRTADLFGGAV